MSGHNHKHFDKIKVEKNTEGEAVLTGEMTLEALKEARTEALRVLNGRLEISGFRKGNIPENVLVKNVGEMKVLEETAEVALGHEYGNIVKEAGVSPIGRPEIAITKMAPGIPLEFKITVTLKPEFDLPDYKKIIKKLAREKEDLNVTEAEVDAVLQEIEKHGWKPQLKEGEELRAKAKENLVEEKKYRNVEKRRLSIVDALIKATQVKIPRLLIETELDRMVAQFQDDVTRHGLKWDEYLKSIKKSEEDIKKEWKEKAEARSKAELIMIKIAETEKLEPSPEELERETKHVLSHHKDADPMRVRIYVYQQLQNQKVFEFLETL